jgi:uncharacterized 2Fe-2S/4Fe-4S cluster protein (DUF4445 family)
MPQVFFENGNASVAVEKGTTVLEAARLAGIALESPCNATGVCGKCKVTIDGKETLACQYKVEEDTSVQARDYAEENKSLQILTGGGGFAFEHKPFITKKFLGNKTLVYGGGALLGEEPGDATGSVYGLAVDIGTTTLVAALVDLLNGKTLALESALNPQAAYAQDVLGRIRFASKGEGLQILYNAFSEALETMIQSLTEKTGVVREHIYEAVYSGNTTMLHLACAVDPAPLGQFPYTPNLSGGEHRSAEKLRISPFGLIWLPPVISAYVGADIVSGILASRLDEKKGATIFIDIGTNGEIALARDGSLAASSTAAGPAFEGMNISCGMRANRGAIESFVIDGEACSFELIGGGPQGGAAEAAGICGSGLLDMAGELVRTGLVGKNGRFAKPGETANALERRFRPLNGKNAFFVTDTVYLTQNDIRQIQLAKGAIRCGIEMLLANFGMDAAAVDSVEIAGSFGYHLRESSLLNIGLLPPQFAGKIAFVGNTSMTGSIAFLMNTDLRSKMQGLVPGIDKVDLSDDQSFERTFVKYLSF